LYQDPRTANLFRADELDERLARPGEVCPRAWYQNTAWALFWVALHLILFVILTAGMEALIWLIPRFPL